MVTLYNWRTGKFIYRKVLDYGRMTGLTYGEPQGLVIRHDKYGHAIFYIALVNGDEGARKVNIFKFIKFRYIMMQKQTITNDSFYPFVSTW